MRRQPNELCAGAASAGRSMLASALQAFVGVFLAAWLAGFTRDVGYRFLWCAVFGLAWYGSSRFWSSRDRRLKACFGALGGLFVLATALGLRLEAAGETGLWGLLASLALAGCFGPAAGWAFFSLSRALLLQKRRMEWPMKRAFWTVLAVLVICWLPVLVAYFPGITAYDMDFQMYQLQTGDYSSHHPLLHTLFVGAFYWLGCAMGSPTLGYGMHILTQSILLAASIAYAMAWLCTIRCHRIGWLALLAFFALSPQHAIMAASGTKDVLFAAAMLTTVVELCRFLKEPKRRKSKPALVRCALMLAVAGMLRNNAIYGFLLLTAIGFLFFRKKLGRRLFAVMLAGIVLAYAGTSALNALTHARPGSVREMMSVPCQQLSRVYAKYGLDVPVGYEIREVLPDAENYYPSRADFTKSSAKITTPERMMRFLKLWAREAPHYPIEYIDAFLYTTKGFWYVDDTSFATTYDEIPGSPVGCMSLGHNDSLGIDAPALLPGLRQCWRELFTLNGYQRFPVLWTLLQPAFYTWLLGFGFAWAAYRRRRPALFAAGILFSYLLTLFLGPCALIRYQYNLMLSAPVLVAFLCTEESDGTETGLEKQM